MPSRKSSMATFMLQDLKKTRQELGLSLTQLARILQFSPTQLREWEEGKTTPTLINFAIWCESLGYRLSMDLVHPGHNPADFMKTSKGS